MLSPHDDKGNAVTNFSELFARSTDIYEAMKEVMAASKTVNQPIDPADVVRELMAHYSDVSLSPTALLEEVVRAAADAGVMLKVKTPGPESL